MTVEFDANEADGLRVDMEVFIAVNCDFHQTQWQSGKSDLHSFCNVDGHAVKLMEGSYVATHEMNYIRKERVMNIHHPFCMTV